MWDQIPALIFLLCHFCRSILLTVRRASDPKHSDRFWLLRVDIRVPPAELQRAPKAAAPGILEPMGVFTPKWGFGAGFYPIFTTDCPGCAAVDKGEPRQ